MRNIVLYVLFFMLPYDQAIAEGYVGNTFGIEGKYRIFEFLPSGQPLKPVTNAETSRAWPSAIKFHGITRVFASEYSGAKWGSIKLYTSTGGVYSETATVYIADRVSEQYGIGPSTVTYDGNKYRSYYLIRGPNGPGSSIGLAISSDGLTFKKVGVVFRSSSYDLSLSYVCTNEKTTYLLLQRYNNDHTEAVSIIAASDNLNGPFSYVATVLRPNKSGGTITGSVGNAFASFTGDMRIGEPIVVNGQAVEYYIPKVVHGTTVYFDRPLDESVQATPYANIISRKPDLSFIRKMDSKWVGAVTGYGQFPNITSEITVPVSAPSLSGPWQIGSGYFLNPYFESGKLTTENPEPIRIDHTCFN